MLDHVGNFSVQGFFFHSFIHFTIANKISRFFKIDIGFEVRFLAERIANVKKTITFNI